MIILSFRCSNLPSFSEFIFLSVHKSVKLWSTTSLGLNRAYFQCKLEEFPLRFHSVFIVHGENIGLAVQHSHNQFPFSTFFKNNLGSKANIA